VDADPGLMLASYPYVMSNLPPDPLPTPRGSDDRGEFLSRGPGSKNEQAEQRGRGEVDVVPSARMPKALKMGANKSRVRGERTAFLVRDLMIDGSSQREVAEEVGISQRHVRRLWRMWVARAKAGPTKDQIAKVRVFEEARLRRLIDQGLLGFPESAGHGAAALRALSDLAKLYGFGSASSGT